MLTRARSLACPALFLACALMAGCAEPISDADEDLEADGAAGPVAAGCDSEATGSGGARTPGFIDARIECRERAGVLVCDGDGSPLPALRYGLLATPAPDGQQSWRAVYTDAPVLCRGYCSIYGSHYELVSGDPLCEGRAVFLEDGLPITVSTRRAASPAQLPPAWAFDWAYARHVLAEDPDEPAEEWPSPRTISLRAPEGGTVDEERALLGLVLRLDVDMDSARLPEAVVVAGTIVRLHRSRKMAGYRDNGHRRGGPRGRFPRHPPR